MFIYYLSINSRCISIQRRLALSVTVASGAHIIGDLAIVGDLTVAGYRAAIWAIRTGLIQTYNLPYRL